MRLAAFFLADHASTRENLLYVIGGGINLLGAPGFPVPLGIGVAGILDFEPAEEGAHPFRLVLRRVGKRRDLGRVLGNVAPQRRPDAAAEAPLSFVFALDLTPLVIPEPGNYEVVLYVDERRLGITRFTASVRDTPFGSWTPAPAET